MNYPHDEHAAPTVESEDDNIYSHGGLTIRETVALHVFAAIPRAIKDRKSAREAFTVADAFCDELKKQRETAE